MFLTEGVNAMDTPDNLYGAEEAGELTGRSSVAVRKLARKYNLGRRVGKSWIFTDADLDKLREIPPIGGRRKADGSPATHSVDTATLIERRRKR
jgi:hypothetical protein